MSKAMNWRKRTLATAAVLLLAAAPAGAVTVSLVPDDADFFGESLQSVQVVVDEVQDLLGASVILAFDPAVVTPVGATVGAVFEDGPCNAFFQWVNAGDFVDTVELDAAMLGCTTGGGGVLMTVAFAGVDAGTSPLTLLEVDLRDGDNAAIACDTAGGQLSYLPEITSFLTVQPESQVIGAEGTCEVCLELTGVEDFLGLSLVLGFDPAVIMPTGISSGSALEAAPCPAFLEWVNPDGFTDTIAIDAALLGCTVAMDGPVVCITFEGIASGESALEWLEYEVRDGQNENVPVLTTGGTVLFDSAVSTTPLPLDLLKASYR